MNISGTRLTGALIIMLSLTVAISAPTEAKQESRPSVSYADPPATKQLRIIDQNLDRNRLAFANIMAYADSKNAMVILLQEVCFDDYMATKTAHPGWTISFLADHETCGPTGENGGVNGNMAIWTGGAPGDGGSIGPNRTFNNTNGQVDLGNRGRSKSNIVCVQFLTQYKACSTHIVANAQGTNVKSVQIGEVVDHTAGWISNNKTVIVGGDFNLVPLADEMGLMYKNGSGSTGDFHESSRTTAGNLCRCGVPTTTDGNRKIDYVFVSSNAFPTYADSDLEVTLNASPASSPTNSGHRRLYATPKVIDLP